jgi:hypothetical protein
VIETDPGLLRDTFAGRASGDGFLALSDVEQATVVDVNRRYGLWLRDVAEEHDQPWLHARPWDTLPSRARDAMARIG